MRARSVNPAPWRVRGLALSYAVFVSGVCSYVVVWHLVAQPSASYWAEPLCLVARPLTHLIAAIESTSGPLGSVLCIVAGAVQAGVFFAICAWIDRALARRGRLSAAGPDTAVPDLRRLSSRRADQGRRAPGRGGDDNVARGTSV